MGTVRSAFRLVVCYAVMARAYAAGLTIAITVLDSVNRPTAGIHLDLRSGPSDTVLATVVTDVKGQASFTDLEARPYDISITKEGFEAMRREIDLSMGDSAAVELTLVPSLARRDNVEVKATADAVEQGSTAPVTLDGRTARELPSRPATVSDALPLVPGVVREAGGALLISASAEHRSALIVNSADVTDPATGQFGLTVPIDSVEALNVYQAPYLAEFGRFSAGLVTVETRRGGDHWKWELNDPLPEFRIRSHHLRGLRTATPRLNSRDRCLPANCTSPRAWSTRFARRPCTPCPSRAIRSARKGVNTFTQLDWIASERQLVTGTAHIAPQRLGHVNMDYFNPEETTPDASTHNYTGTVTDR